MVVRKLSMSLSPELVDALRDLAGEGNVSRLVETLLREHPLVRARIGRLRAKDALPPLRKGRDIDELMALAVVADREWRGRIESGRLGVIGTE